VSAGGAGPITGDPMALAERVLDLARTREPGAEVEVLARGGVEALTRFANGAIHQNVAEDVGHLLVRVALDGRTARYTLDGQPDDDAIRTLVDRALDAARVRPVDPEWPGIAPPAAAPDVEHWDEATADAAPAERARRVADFVRAAAGLDAAGYCSSRARVVAYANTRGQHLRGRSTLAVLDGIARTSTSDASARGASAALADLDGAALGERAARRAREAADPVDIEPGAYEVVLGPSCVADIVDFLYRYGFNARAVEEGRSFVQLGRQQFDAAITLLDDVTDPGTVGIPFDAEGTPKRPVSVVDAGVTANALHTRRTAALAGVESTGHAPETGEDWGILAVNPVLAAGDRATEQLIAGMARGLLVTDFHYTRILDPRTEVVTGLTRNGVWLVQDGRVTSPVRNLRFTQSYVAALAPGSVLGVGRDRSLVASADDATGSLVPSLHLRTWNFSGGAMG
jgi:predicted Zn-dependent protease